MSASVLQEKPTDDGGGAGAPTLTSAAFTSNATIGSTIACWVTVSGNGTPPTSVIDSASQHYTLAGTAFSSGSGNQALHLYYFQNNQSATKLTVTATYGTNQTGFGVWPAELGSVSHTGFDGQSMVISVFPGTGANAITTSAVLPTGTPPVLIYSLVMDQNNGTGSGLTAGTGFTILSSGWGFGGSNLARSQFQLLGSDVSTAATAQATSNSVFGIGMGMFDQFVVGPIQPAPGPVVLGGQTAGRIVGTIINTPTA